YPIALVSYLIACEQYEDENTAALVKAYFEYMASEEGQAAAADNAGSAPISAGLREKVLTAIDTIKVG
ncbi:MAG TPA: phosphate ABC transporter substrate-binding protein PstS, partial [Microbacterium sp.]|nr:phosphate ABC transporter substrate-binding protein PstS [Microbacterium sp.]